MDDAFIPVFRFLGAWESLRYHHKILVDLDNLSYHGSDGTFVASVTTQITTDGSE